LEKQEVGMNRLAYAVHNALSGKHTSDSLPEGLSESQVLALQGAAVALRKAQGSAGPNEAWAVSPMAEIDPKPEEAWAVSPMAEIDPKPEEAWAVSPMAEIDPKPEEAWAVSPLTETSKGLA
jgi:hypothetical protein